MSVLAESFRVAYNALVASGVRLVSALAETWLVQLTVWDDIGAGGLEVYCLPRGEEDMLRAVIGRWRCLCDLRSTCGAE